MSIRVRFAPSPTGNLHIGTLRAALFNWLYAKSQGGTFILRIEDTDYERSESKYEQNILDGLNWLALNVDEGPIQGGDYGPYRQSERIDQQIYQQYAQKLLDKGLAYYCFLTPEDIQKEKESAIKSGIPYMHSRQSLEMSSDEVQKCLNEGKPYAIRFKMTQDRAITHHDEIRGSIEFDCSLLSDFVLIKSDGTPSYNFAVVVDDALMNISHVIRGEDHISNMPRQLAIYEALSFDIPIFAHLPMILGPDKSKLSKRHGATAVTDYQERGFLKDSFLNYLSLLGWSPKDENELLLPHEIIEQFSLSRVNKSGAVFDIKKLIWMNGQYIRKYDQDSFYDLILNYVSEKNLNKLNAFSIEKKKMALFSVRDNLDVLSDINDYLDVYLESDDEFLEKLSLINFSDVDLVVLNYFKTTLNNKDSDGTPQDFNLVLEDIISNLKLSKGKVFKPIRFAITGKGSGPNITQCLSFFGKELLIKRLNYTLDQ